MIRAVYSDFQERFIQANNIAIRIELIDSNKWDSIAVVDDTLVNQKSKMSGQARCKGQGS